jgi:hypothetical protein
MASFKVDPILKDYRSEPRFSALEQRGPTTGRNVNLRATHQRTSCILAEYILRTQPFEFEKHNPRSRFRAAAKLDS